MNLEAAQSAFPALLGHLLYGAAAALVFVAFRWRPPGVGGRTGHLRRGLVRGGVAGLAGAALLGPTIGGPHSLVATWPGSGRDGRPRVGRNARPRGSSRDHGLRRPVPAHRREPRGPPSCEESPTASCSGSSRRSTIFPVLEGSGIAWPLDEARAAFSNLHGPYLFLGVALAVLYHWLDALGRKLLSDEVAPWRGREVSGAQAMRALGRGIAAGLVGGALFTPVWIQVDFFPNVAGLVGGTSTGLGIFVHLLIAQVVGATYGVFFRRQSFDLGSALGWGAAYGFFWWNLGSPTLPAALPRRTDPLGCRPRGGRVPGARRPSDLRRRARVSLTYYAIEARHNPWWIARTQAEAERRERRPRARPDVRAGAMGARGPDCPDDPGARRVAGSLGPRVRRVRGTRVSERAGAGADHR